MFVESSMDGMRQISVDSGEMTATSRWSSWWHVIVMVGLVSATCVNCTQFTDHCAVQLDGGIDEARIVAMQHGFIFVNEVRRRRCRRHDTAVSVVSQR